MLARAQSSSPVGRRFLFAAACGIAVAVLVVGLAQTLLQSREGVETRAAKAEELPRRGNTLFDDEGAGDDNPAMAYARAVREGDADKVVAMLDWMQNRLDWVKTHPDGAEDLEKVRKELAGRVLDRNPAGNVLRDEGCEDQHIFTPGCELRLLREDAGAEHLEKPAARRAWMTVTYPAKALALLNDRGQPIRSLTVGVNLTPENKVLKAAVTGNLEIDFDSITCDWP